MNLETKPEEALILSVQQLNLQIKQILEGNVGWVWVRAELSNFKAHTSGHFYFSLKDSQSQISAVMFRGSNAKLKFKPTDGMEVLVRGRVSVYEVRGNYQIICDIMEPVGAGALQKAFEQLKAKLKAEGLFETSRKRAIPSFPQHVAVVSSPTGAAIRDIINILSRRAPMIPVTVVPTQVQGEAAIPQIVEALEKAYRLPNVQVIIIGRGGGSIEDLWAFNSELVARKISESPVPIISAVGHEIDFTIADFVADLRAPTPSAAAELVAQSSAELKMRIQQLNRILFISQSKYLQNLTKRLAYLTSHLIDPQKKLQDLMLRNDELYSRLERATNHRVQKFQHRLTLQMKVLENLSPLKVVSRGYSLVHKGEQLIKNSQQVEIGDELSIRLANGQITAKVLERI